MKNTKAASHIIVRSGSWSEEKLDLRPGAVEAAISAVTQCQHVQQDEGSDEGKYDHEFHCDSPVNGRASVPGTDIQTPLCGWLTNYRLSRYRDMRKCAQTIDAGFPPGTEFM